MSAIRPEDDVYHSASICINLHQSACRGCNLHPSSTDLHRGSSRPWRFFYSRPWSHRCVSYSRLRAAQMARAVIYIGDDIYIYIHQYITIYYTWFYCVYHSAMNSNNITVIHGNYVKFWSGLCLDRLCLKYKRTRDHTSLSDYFSTPVTTHSGFACTGMIERSMTRNPGTIGVCGWGVRCSCASCNIDCSMMNKEDAKMQPWEKVSTGKTSA